MWERIKMIFRSLFGGLLRSAEDPERILRQHMDDLRSKLPELNRQVAEVVKLEKMLEMQAERLRDKYAKLEQQVLAAVKLGDAHKETAKALIGSLESSKTELADTEAQLVQAKVNSERAMQARDTFERRIKQQINEAMRQISRARRAKIEEEMSELMMAFEVGDTSEVMDRMTAQIDERLARAQARTEVSGANMETQLADVEAAAVSMEAESKYQEYQRQLGLLPDEEPAARTMQPVIEETDTQIEPQANTQEN